MISSAPCRREKKRLQAPNREALHGSWKSLINVLSCCFYFMDCLAKLAWMARAAIPFNEKDRHTEGRPVRGADSYGERRRRMSSPSARTPGHEGDRRTEPISISE